MKKILLLSVLFLAVSACTMPQTNIYSLYLPVEKTLTVGQSDMSVAVSVKTPKYLSQPYMVYRDSPYKLEIAKYSKWHSSPNEILKDAFKTAMGSAGLFREVITTGTVPADFFLLKISLTAFERFDEDADSFAVLAFDAEFFSPEGKRLYGSAVSKKVRLADKTFLSLAKGLSSALSQGMEEVKADLAKKNPARP